MTISSAYIFGKQLTAGEAPPRIVWFNSRNASPMQSFGDNGDPCIKNSGSSITFLGRNNQYFPEPAAGFIGIDATKVTVSDLPYTLDIPLVKNGVEINWKLRVKAVFTGSGNPANTLRVDLSVYQNDPEDPAWHQGDLLQNSSDDISLGEFYVFTGAGAFLGARDGSELTYNTAYIGVIVAGVDWQNKRYVNVGGATVDLNYMKTFTGGGELPSKWLT